MGLNLVFEQRKIGRQHTSLAAYVPLRTPSGAQETESQLETDLVLQLNFSPSVYDLITQPIINYVDASGKQRRYSPDVLVHLFAGDPDHHRYIMIEAKPVEILQKKWDAYQPAFNAAREWCAHNFADFRVVTEHEIRTPYLSNTVALSRYWNSDPEPKLMNALWGLTDRGPVSVEAAMLTLGEMGASEPDAILAIECAVANRYVACDLSKEFTKDSHLCSREGADFKELEPILHAVRSSIWQDNRDRTIFEKNRIKT